MHRKLILLSIFVLNSILSAFAYKDNLNEYNNTNVSYKVSDTISFDNYLSIKKTKRDLNNLKVNSNGDVTYRNKVVLTSNGLPLNNNTAYSNNEFKVLFSAQKIKPKKGCNPQNIKKNGSIGCYIDNPS